MRSSLTPLGSLSAALFLGAGAFAAEPERSVFHLDEEMEREIGYAQAVRAADMLFVSGTAAAGDSKTAIHEVYGKLQKTLAAHGLTFAHVVKETVYATHLDSFIEHKALRRSYYGETLPAATWVQVQRLYVPQLVLEVELIASFPKER